jgi:spermidine synthase
MYFSGFTASSFEILLIFTFQTYFGYVYAAIGLIIALFMGGLVLGSLYAGRLLPGRKQFISAQVFLSVYALLFTAFWTLQTVFRDSRAGFFLFCLMTLLVSMITGFQYVIGTKILAGNYSHTASLLYSADLIGAALGTIILTLLLLPLAGVLYSCLIIGALNLLISILMALRKN